MSHSALTAGLQYLRGVVASNRHSDDSDETLLHAFAAHRDESAFAALVRRHGPMVLHVCRRVLGHDQDAEDAFQATFLVLARDAGRLRKKTALASFLHGTAYRLALSAKRAAARRRRQEGSLGALTQPRSPGDPVDELSWREVRTLLDEEIARLPDGLRSVFILCCLEELSQAEAGRRLGLKERTVSNRLAEARKRLAQRLARRGVELTAVLSASTVAASQASALPASLVASTIKTAMATAAGKEGASVISASVAELMKEGGAGLIVRTTKTATVLLLAATVLGGVGLWFSASLPSALDTPKVPAQRSPQANKSADTTSLILRGRVVGPDSKPVAGAKLYLPRGSEKQRQEKGEAALVERGIADKEGRFRLELPRAAIQPDRVSPLVAAADGFGLAWVDLPRKEEASELTLRLVKDVPIHGRLLTTEGKPVAGVTVIVGGLMAFERLDDFLRVYQHESRHIDEGTGARSLQWPLNLNPVLNIQPTDKDGRFEIRGLGVERLVGLRAKSEAIAPAGLLVVTRENFDAKAYLKSMVRGKGEQTPHLFGTSFEYVVDRAVAQTKKEIEGVVREAGSGKPVAGAVIQAYGASAVSDEKGLYRLAGMQMQKELGQYILSVTAPSDQPLIGRSVRVTPAADGKPLRVDAELPRGVVVTGRLYDKATGKGVPGWIDFAPLPENKTPRSKREGLSLNATSGEDGRFRLVTIPGPGVLLAQAHNSFKIDGVSISPYKLAEFDPADRPRIKIIEDPKGGRSIVTADGSRTLNFFQACHVLDVKDDGKAVSCDLTLDPGKSLTVNLVDPDGKPQAGAVVAGVGIMTLRAVPFKTASGRIYALDPDNPRPVVFLHVERKLAVVVSLRGDEKEPLTIRLTPAGVVTGRVLDGDGQPLAGAEIYTLYKTVGHELTKSQTRWSLPRTDKDGRFRVEGIVPGIKVELGFIKGRQMLVPRTPLEIKPLQSGQTLDVGDVRVKPRKP